MNAGITTKQEPSRSTYDVLVLGSGAYGAATAFNLAARGLDVAVLERLLLASQTSARAAGLATAPHGTEQSSRIALRSLEIFRRFEDETGELLRVWETGSLKIARRADDVGQLEREVAAGVALGMDVELVDAAEVGQRAPFVDVARVVAARWTPGDLYLNPPDVVTASSEPRSR